MNRDLSGSFEPELEQAQAIDGGFKVIDANKQAIAYVYGPADKRDAETVKGLEVVLGPLGAMLLMLLFVGIAFDQTHNARKPQRQQTSMNHCG